MLAMGLAFIYGYFLGLHGQMILLKTSHEAQFSWLRPLSLFRYRQHNPFVSRIRRRAIVYGILFALVWFYRPTIPTMAIFTLLALLYVAAGVDYLRGIIPDGIALGGVILGLIFSSVEPINSPALFFPTDDFNLALLLSALTGVLITSGVLLWTAIIFEKMTHRDGLGFGDVKLAGMLGAFLGWQGGLRVLIYGAWVALFMEMLRFLLLRRLSPERRIPFAPYIALGAIFYFWRLRF